MDAGLFFWYDTNGNRRIRGRLRLSAAESSIHASSVSAITVSDRVAHAETSKKEDTWHEILGHCDAGFDSALRVFEGW